VLRIGMIFVAVLFERGVERWRGLGGGTKLIGYKGSFGMI